MKVRRILLFALAAVLLLTGCAMPTLEDMYCLPKRSDAHTQLQTVLDQAMTGLQYSAPLSGSNRQTVQTADLDGDGIREYLVFARGESDTPMRILLICQSGSTYTLLDTIECTGYAFEQVAYVDMDDTPGAEIVVGTQLSDQVLGTVSVYSFASGSARQLMSTHYSKFLTCDLDENGLQELMVIRPGESEAENAAAVLYSFADAEMERSPEKDLSRPVDAIKRIMVSTLYGGLPAVYVASAVDETAIVTDVFAVKDGKFSNISYSNESGTSVNTLRNYYVFADDMDADGILELPGLITMKSVGSSDFAQQQYLIRWFSMDADGGEVKKLHTFHNFLGGWYLVLEGEWARRVSVVQSGDTFTFYVWDEGFSDTERIFTLHVLTGNDRQEDAVIENRFVLYRTESVVYAAKLDAASVSYGITEESLVNSFRLIREDWNKGET